MDKGITSAAHHQNSANCCASHAQVATFAGRMRNTLTFLSGGKLPAEDNSAIDTCYWLAHLQWHTLIAQLMLHQLRHGDIDPYTGLLLLQCRGSARHA
jgi:hypothetical protein